LTYEDNNYDDDDVDAAQAYYGSVIHKASYHWQTVTTTANEATATTMGKNSNAWSPRNIDYQPAQRDKACRACDPEQGLSPYDFIEGKEIHHGPLYSESLF
jgi:hypothetical protein